ncbi:MAG: peptide-methionine (S)-S-oxide reductase MsrA [Sphingomonadales bacterium]|nr:peptide-methionine (S)-S-oxide reductase MsrA [Sphingomonadales bacterium]
MKRLAQVSIVAACLATACQRQAFAEAAIATPAAAVEARETQGLKTAIFAGGCYWGVEGVFSHVRGVTSAVSGFEGGSADTAHYERVSEGDTGHAESVRVTYNPAVVRYDQLLQVFFGVIADPTELDFQGPDTGTQYRSALVPLSPEQRRVAAGYLAQLKVLKLWRRPIVTAIEPYRGFYPAARDHQDFMQKNPDHPYIVMWDKPKVAALRRLFPALYKASFTAG